MKLGVTRRPLGGPKQLPTIANKSSLAMRRRCPRCCLYVHTGLLLASEFIVANPRKATWPPRRRTNKPIDEIALAKIGQEGSRIAPAIAGVRSRAEVQILVFPRGPKFGRYFPVPAKRVSCPDALKYLCANSAGNHCAGTDSCSVSRFRASYPHIAPAARASRGSSQRARFR